MKAFFLFFCLFTASISFAYNTKYHRVQPGQKIYIDTAHQKFISVLYITESADKDSQPEVQLVNQWSGFECQHKQTLIQFAGFEPSKGLYFRDWEIQFDYSPGADLSGCIYLIKFPGVPDATVELNMIY